jgi:hypothetical protein
VNQATDESIRRLDTNFFRVRFDRLAPREKQYLRTLADMGETVQRSGEFADRLGVKVQSVAPGLKVATPRRSDPSGWRVNRMSTQEPPLTNEELEKLVKNHPATTPLGRALRELQDHRAPTSNEATELSDVEKRDLPSTDET